MTVTVRAVAIMVFMVYLYFALPFDRLGSAGSIAALVLGLAGLVVTLVWQVRSILRARFPGVRAIEAFATLIPLFLLLFATLYYLLERAQPASFNEHMSRMDSLYFTVTTFATVGYGDIVATTSGARIAVTLQMVADLIVIGVGIKALLGAVQLGRKLRAQDSPAVQHPDQTSRTPTSGR